MQKIKNSWQLILIALLAISVSWPLMRGGYFSHQDDLQVIRIVEMRKCFSDLQIPCRWVPDMGWGNGMPLFNFYGVFTYYVGAILSYVFGYLISAKILFFMALTFGSYGIYLLVKDLWGKNAALISSVLYLLAPYKALDIYVRGALTESIALSIIPFVLYFGYRKNYKYFILSLFFFLITHNIMTIIFLPVIFAWMFYLLYVNKFTDLKLVLISFTIAFGMSAFFLAPAFLEKDLVQTESLTRFELDYRANFISVKQLFLDRVWGYGTSIPGPEGGMNFSIGWPHWILATLSLFVLFFKKVDKKTKFLVFLIFMTFLMSVFMTHNQSTFIWKSISVLHFFQFPWRFLSLAALTTSLLGGFVVSVIRDKWQIYLTILIIAFAVLANWNYFKPREFFQITEKEKLTGEMWEAQRKGALLDYLPKTGLEPREGAQFNPLITLGSSEITNFINRSNSFEFNIKVYENSEIELPIYYFPNWQVYVNGKEAISNHENSLGRISIALEVGEYKVNGKFKNTPIRTVSNVISLISAAGFLYFLKLQKKKIK